MPLFPKKSGVNPILTTSLMPEDYSDPIYFRYASEVFKGNDVWNWRYCQGCN